MTAAPAEQTDADRTGTAAAGLTWAVCFAALIAVYVVACVRHERACEAAAAWGLAISLVAALLAVAFAVARPAVSGVAKAPRAAVTVLAAALLAVTGVAVNLTLGGQTAGAWTLTVVAVGAVAAGLLFRLAAPVPVPGEVIAHEEPPAREAPVALLVPPDDRTSTTAALPVAEPPPVAEQPLVTGRRGLLSEDWADRLGSEPPGVAVDAGFWSAMLAKLGKRGNEIGGVALTIRVPGTIILLGAVLPDQLKETSIFCEFPAEDVYRVRAAIDAAAGVNDIDTANVTISWVHTHPRMGPFLSGTDVETARTWREFDPEFTPIVIDPLGHGIDHQIGVFNAGNEAIVPVRIIKGLASGEALAGLKEELLDVYRRAGARHAMIIIPGGGR
jgi:hypothetical protein